MKQSVLCVSYISILILTISCSLQFSLIEVRAEDGEIVQTASATVSIQENIQSNDTSEKETSPNLDNIVKSDVLEPSVDTETSFQIEKKDNVKELNQQVFSEVASQNSGVANEVISSGAPVVLTLSDPATAELQQRADIPSVVTSQNDVSSEAPHKNKSQDNVETVPSKNLAEEVSENRSEPSVVSTETTDNLVRERNEPKNQTVEEIPSFSEWAQKRLEEAEKNEQVNSSVQGQNVNGKQGSGAKLRWKNYASLDCGAKVIASNPEAVSPWAILSPSRDEYKLNTCTSRIWFVVELCEAIQAKRIDLANYELFSSSPKDFSVSVSDRFPTRDWSPVGHFTAKDERDIQSFDLDPHIFGKYIKVEIKSHYGSEHFCPISLFRAYGINVFEVLQKEDPAHENRIDDDDDDDETLDTVGGESPKNLFTSATNAVISMVKKAAEVLGNKANLTNGTSETKVLQSTKYTPLIQTCTTPSHLVVCNNCSDTLFGQIYELLSCKSTQIKNIIGIPYIRKVLTNSLICSSFGFDFRNKSLNHTLNSCSDCIKSFFPTKFLGAMCNTVAILENKVVLNISQHYSNITQNVTTDEKIVHISTSEPHIIKKETVELKPVDIAIENNAIKPTDPLVLEQTETLISSSTSDISVTSQIKPTKALTSDIDVNHLTESSTVTIEQPITHTDTVVQPSETAEKQEEHVVTEAPPIEGATEHPAVEQESIENIEDPIDHLLDLNGEHGQNNVNSATTTSTPPGQKESVFLRLSNRIKALERNMSLSGQYLEELSKRYKKQVEEMQKLLEKTIFTIHEESKKKDERNKQLEERLDQLAAAVDLLLADRNSWSSTFFWILFTSIIGVCVFTFCRRTADKRSDVSANETVEVHRRKSIDVVTHNPPPKKKRRPSDQALKICRSMSATDSEKRVVKEKRKKKKKPLKRSNSINTLSEEKDYSPSGSDRSNGDWIEGQNNHIEDVPFALDEMEHSTLEDLPVDPELTKIDVPDFMQTASNTRLSRCSSQNGPMNVYNLIKERKALSLDESNNKPLLQALNGNGTAGNSSAEDTPKKEKKSFKKLFKKVF